MVLNTGILQYFNNLLLVFCVTFCFSQELPPINNFTPLAYNGGNQNWSISQSNEQFIYVGNNYGLLEYNGASWKLYSTPNRSNIRSVKVVNNLVYTGCYMEFGFWKRDSFGKLNYQSLNPKLTIPMIQDEEFWNIVHLDKWVLFQSLQRIYVYNIKDETFSIIDSESTRARIFVSKGIVYFQKSGKGLFKIERGKGALVSEDPMFKSNIIIGFFESKFGKTIVTEKTGFYLLENDQIKKWEIPVSNLLNGVNVYSSIQLKDGSFVLGTISDGLYYINANGELIEKINQRKGLYDNTVHSLFEDLEGNIWLALNNGISVINLNSPFNEYLDKIGKLGVVYTAAVYKDYLYLGTNQGLFYKSKDGDEDFKLIENTNGQVWFLKEIDDVLFCGHNDGTFIVEANRVKIISTFPGAWDIKKIPGIDSLLLQGNYKGLSVLKRENKNWIYRNKIEGFEISSRFFEFTSNNELIVNHEYKGIFKLAFDAEFKRVSQKIEIPEMGSGASLVNYDGSILYTSSNGVYRYNVNNQKFENDSLFTKLFFKDDEKPFGILIPDAKNNLLWSFTDNNIIYVSPNKFNGSAEASKIAIPNFFRRSIGVLGFENITPLFKDKYLIGISNGYITLDLTKLNSKDYFIFLHSVYNKNADSRASKEVPLNNDSNKFDYKDNNLYLEYNVPNFEKYTEVNYQYQLIGLSDKWSTWSENAKVSFENLPFGKYTFNVRAKEGNNYSANTATFSFEILRPWYLTNLAILAYIALLGSLAFVVHRLYRRHYRRQQDFVLKENQKKLKRKKIKADKKLIQIKNEKLNQEIDSKSRELAISTMSIIKKNEFLNAIKLQLQDSKTPSHVNEVIKTIDRNINNEDDWKFFENAFNNADKEFLKKVKKVHSDLTPNDLRLCAYLRLNLSSKEIAPLLNISVRSVEVKRYRLRKKIDLPHESSLTDYILNL